MFFGSIPALVTPFCEGGALVDYDMFRKLIQFHIEEGSSALLIGGTTGEAPTLEFDELEQMISVAVEESNGQIPIIVGTGTNATEKSVRLTRLAKRLGAAACLAVVPYYNCPMHEGITKHFATIAKEGLPIIVYHHPGRTGISLSVDQLLELADIPEVIGIKDSSESTHVIGQVLRERPTIAVYGGVDENLFDLLTLGAVGSISIVANVVPKQWRSVIQDVWDGNEERAENTLEDLRTLLWALSLEVNPQGIKSAVSRLLGIENSLRLPLIPVCEKTQAEIDGALKELGLPIPAIKTVST